MPFGLQTLIVSKLLYPCLFDYTIEASNLNNAPSQRNYLQIGNLKHLLGNFYDFQCLLHFLSKLLDCFPQVQLL